MHANPERLPLNPDCRNPAHTRQTKRALVRGTLPLEASKDGTVVNRLRRPREDLQRAVTSQQKC